MASDAATIPIAATSMIASSTAYGRRYPRSRHRDVVAREVALAGAVTLRGGMGVCQEWERSAKAKPDHRQGIPAAAGRVGVSRRSRLARSAAEPRPANGIVTGRKWW
jgi:hypothetical protein